MENKINKDIESILGFDRIRQMVKQNCISPLGTSFVDEMRFERSYEKIFRHLRLIEEFKTILVFEQTFPEQDFFDLRSELKRLKLDGTFISKDLLLDFFSSLRTIRACVQFFLSHEECPYPYWLTIAKKVIFPDNILKLASQLVDKDGEIPDHASPELSEIRREIRRIKSKIDQSILALLRLAKKEGWSPNEAEITIRNGRCVIPILATNKRKVKGLVHDESATGNTYFIEPAEVVELNNDLKSAKIQEEREIVKILLAFTDTLRPFIPDLLQGYRFLGIVDFVRAKAKFAFEIQAGAPLLSRKPTIEWFEAKHPLLFLKFQKQKREVIPFNLALNDEQRRILIISGPNAGGKSICLKTVGLLQYMLQCGLLVPLRPTSEMGIFEHIFMDIGDDQSLDNDLSTYSSHLQNMCHLLKEANQKTLFLIDEFGSGTDPNIGGALAASILEELNRKKAVGVVTSHYAALKALGDHNEGIINGAMLFDRENLKPLFRLHIGRPGSSFAFEIAKEIGLPDHILRKAAKQVGQKYLDFDQQLHQMEEEKMQFSQKKREVELADELLSELISKHQTQIDEMERNKKAMIAKAKSEALEIIQTSNRRVEQTIAEIKRAQADKEATKKARQQLSDFAKELKTNSPQEKQSLFSEAVEDKATSSRKKESASQKKQKELPTLVADASPIVPGDIVQLGEGQHIGEVLTINAKKAEVLCNDLKITVPRNQLKKIHKQTFLSNARPSREPSRKKTNFIYDDLDQKKADFSPYVDVRGMSVDESLSKIAHVVDDALMLGEQELCILHGKGYGILKTAIRDYLRNMHEVKHLSGGNPDQEGEGVTLVVLK